MFNQPMRWSVLVCAGFCTSVAFAGMPSTMPASGTSREPAERSNSVPGAASVSLASQIIGMGHTVVNDDVGTSGDVSTYHDTDLELMTAMPTLGAGLVTYPSGVGTVPSPGGQTARLFDQGALGYRIDGGNLIVAVAGGIDPQNWPALSGYGNAQFGLGDLFLEVDNGGTIEHYAALNSMNSGAAISGHGTYFNAAQAFRAGSASVGDLVKMTTESDVLRTGQSYSYTRPGPSGLDTRAFCRSGTVIAGSSVAFSSTVADEPLGDATPMNWYVTEWTIPLSSFGIHGTFDIALHVTTTCGNDQIGGLLSVTANEPPGCDAGGPYVEQCTGGTTKLLLDGSASSDPDDDSFTYLWTTDCPGGSFDDDTSATPSLTVDTAPGCDVECTASLTVEDTFGDSAECNASVTVEDTTDPEITCPADTTIECDESTDPSNTGEATASDNCDGDPTISSADIVAPGACDGESVLTRAWTATDDCGNSTTCDQTITLEDTTDPIIGDCPGNISIMCAANPGEAIEFTVPGATDNCNGGVTVTCDPASGSVFPTGPDPVTTVVTCTAQDACGHSDACSFEVTLVSCGACCNFNGTCTDDTLQSDCLTEPFRVWTKDAACADTQCNAIPTVSQWGLVVMTLLGLTLGTLIYRSRNWHSALK